VVIGGAIVPLYGNPFTTPSEIRKVKVASGGIDVPYTSKSALPNN